MHGYYIFTVLLLLTTLFTYINARWSKLPVSIAVTIFSLVMASLLILFHQYFPRLDQLIKSNFHRIQFDEIVIDILLGFLLFAAAFQIDDASFKRHLPVIVSTAILSTLLSVFLVGTLVYYSFQAFHYPVSYPECLLFGAVISPTDPVAALAILKKVGIPKKTELQITGESLLNDGIAIVVFLTLLNLISPQKEEAPVTDAMWLFLREAGGALLFGLALGGLAYLLLKSVSNFKVEILITISIVMGGYTLAQMLEISPPLSMVVTGLVCSVGNEKRRHIISHEFVMTFWEIVEDTINVVLFLLIGLGVFVIPLQSTMVTIGCITIVWLLLSRFLSLLPVYALLRKQFEPHSLPLFTWGALRGAVSIALVLSLPYTVHREAFLTITYIVAVFSIVVQGLTIQPLAKALGFGVK